VKDRAAAAREAHVSPAAYNLAHDCVNLSGDDFGDGGEADAVLVSKRKIAEEIADGGDAAFFENRRALRPHASQVFHRIRQFEGHGQGERPRENREARQGFPPIFIPSLPAAAGGFLPAGQREPR
jgi:hypothetical protein